MDPALYREARYPEVWRGFDYERVESVQAFPWPDVVDGLIDGVEVMMVLVEQRMQLGCRMAT